MAGDVIATGGSVTINGPVDGDVIAAGGPVLVRGKVKGSVRVSGGDVEVLGAVWSDVIAVGGTVSLGPKSSVARDAILAGGEMSAAGVVGRKLTASGGVLALAGSVGQDVEASIDNLRPRPTASIAGNLSYTSRKEAIVEDGATVRGVTTRHHPTTQVLWFEVEDSPGIAVLKAATSAAQAFLAIVALGLVLLWLFPSATRAAAEAVAGRVLASLGIGVLLLGPLVIVAVIATVFLVGGWQSWPLAFAPAALLLALLAVAGPVVAIALGGLVVRVLRRGEIKAWQALVGGAAILAALGMVPFLGPVVGALTVVIGFGAWVITAAGSRRTARPAQTKS